MESNWEEPIMHSNDCEKKISYTFTDKSLLHCALTHRSFNTDVHNERLEFLGDAILNMIISELLFEQYPEASEGELSIARIFCIQGQHLTMLARKLNLQEFITIAAYFDRNNLQDSILENTLESIIAAIYLDSDFYCCKEWLQQLYQPWLNNPISTLLKKDSKSSLQEYCQAKKIPLPRYTLLKKMGLEHSQTFVIQCQVKNCLSDGQGSSIRQAEQAAAKNCIQQLSQKKQTENTL
jgi:ribonuclease III